MTIVSYLVILRDSLVYFASLSFAAISIGFEFPSYTVEEQNGTVRIDDLIFLIKQDNRSTERSFFVTVRAVNTAPSGSSVATLDDDYALIAGAGPGNRNLLLTFNSFEGRLPIPFEVFADREFEGPEAFQLQSASNEEGPAFSFPDGVTVFSSAFVEITDDDSKCNNFSVSCKKVT